MVVVVVAGRFGVPRARNSSSRVLVVMVTLGGCSMVFSMSFFVVFCFQFSSSALFLLLLWCGKFVAAAAISPVFFVFTIIGGVVVGFALNFHSVGSFLTSSAV